MVSANMEDYLLAIYRLNRDGGPAKTTDIADMLSVSPASVTEMVKRLSEEGLVDYERYRGSTLTPRGFRHAERLHRKHKLVEKFMVNVLRSDPESAHDSACRIEHSLSDDDARSLCRIIGSPEECVCDQGNTGCRNIALVGIPLSEMKKGEKAVISFLKSDSPEKVRKLISMGLVPGRTVKIESEMPMKGPILISLDDSLLVLDREYTSLVMVEKEECA
ncbi:MAG: DtxR family transcriptional regulator, Mn-dependent transcriptional regulator [Candidatus Methanomethylophilaceae archaeon]|nr:DtxR family transcriptional regulator, Mn-dependent transcriptional regulator [Candidatus Methanomethylophilaceae archaeon]MDI3541913.1 DtxR family transcriptional regulator, Mn-dependent transcriptional regulator [Candidatus Methanomethylophilaceae archaeon]